MKLYDLNLTGTQAGGAGRTGAAGAERTQETRQTERAGVSRTDGAASGSGGDRVEFSNTLGRLSQALSADEPGRATRVAQLQAQYQAGAYHADASATARGMVSEALSG